MNFNFDKSISKFISINESDLMDGFDEFDEDDYHGELSSSAMLNNFKYFIDKCNSLGLRVTIPGYDEIKENVIYTYNMTLSFVDMDEMKQFSDLVISYGFLFNVRSLFIYFEKKRSFVRPETKVIFNDDFKYCFDNIFSLSITGGIFENLVNIPDCKNIRFTNSTIKSLEGINSNDILLLLHFEYDIEICCVLDWTYLPCNIQTLVIKYKSVTAAYRYSLLHFNNFPVDALNINLICIVPKEIHRELMSTYKRYISNVFQNDNPNMKKTIIPKIIKKLKTPYGGLH